MWRFALALLVMMAITVLLFRLSNTPEPQRLNDAQQEAAWAAERAKAPFALLLRRADGTQHLLTNGGPGWVVVDPDSLEDFRLAVGGDPAVYAPRAGPLNWHIAVEAVRARDTGIALGETIAWPGGNLRGVTPAAAAPLYGFGPLAPGEVLGFAPAERLLVHCLAGKGSCVMLFLAGRFRVRMVFHQEDRPLIRTIAADLRRCLPLWDGRRITIAAPLPGCQPA